jgi:hypothetical protein
MPGNGLEFDVIRRGEGLPLFPSVCDGGNSPESTFWISDNPLLRDPIDKYGQFLMMPASELIHCCAFLHGPFGRSASVNLNV